MCTVILVLCIILLIVALSTKNEILKSIKLQVIELQNRELCHQQNLQQLGAEVDKISDQVIKCNNEVIICKQLSWTLGFIHDHPFWCAFFVVWLFSFVVDKFQKSTKKYDVHMRKLEKENE